MAHGHLDGAEGLIRPEGSPGESYEAPSGTIDGAKAAAERFMTAYQSGHLKEIIDPYKEGMSPIRLIYLGGIGNHAAALADLLGIAGRTPSELDANTLLERIVDYSAAELPAAEFFYHGMFCDAMTLLIQTLYFEGHNDFVADVSELNGKMERDIGHGIHAVDSLGTFLVSRPEEPLRLACKGAVNKLGLWAHHCHLTHHGEAHQIGSSGRWSTYDLQGTAQRMGWGAEYSAFYLDSVEPMFLAEAKGSVQEKYSDCHTGNSYHVRAGVDRHDIGKLRKLGFWGGDYAPGVRQAKQLFGKELSKSNSLFVPDGSGGWTEVLP